MSWVGLVYHDVQQQMPRTGGGPDRFTVPLAAFERMLDTIAERGYAGCSVERALASRGTRRVAITFDDATRGQFEHAAPALIARGMTATFYVATDWVGQPGFMTWDDLRSLIQAGMSIQSHTRSHPFLSELGASALRRELTESKAILDSELKQDTVELAFPGGDPPAPSLRHIIAESGYRIAVGTRWGTNPDLPDDRAPAGFIKRCTARGEISPEMARRVVNADPWLGIRSNVKESTLRKLRGVLGATRYATYRRTVLDVLAGGRSR